MLDYASGLKHRLETNSDAVRAENKAAWLAHTLYSRVQEKLRREPVEDFRIDFEDGYGNRPDAEEDGHAESAALEVVKGMENGTLPPFIGIRIKPFNEELRARSIHTFDIFTSTVLEKTGGRLPANFVVTLPKVTTPEQVEALAGIFDLMEAQNGLKSGTLKMEMMIETTQSIINHEGKINLPLLLEAAGIWLSDGATNIMPVGPHRAPEGAPLAPAEVEENRAVVHRAWKLHYEHIQHSLIGGFYQGWDLHPAQLPTRYAAVYAFFLESVDAASDRLRNFVEKAAKATLVGDVFVDAATGQGLLNYFLRAINCGAVTEAEAMELTTLTHDEFVSASFVKILKKRQNL